MNWQNKRGWKTSRRMRRSPEGEMNQQGGGGGGAPTPTPSPSNTGGNNEGGGGGTENNGGQEFDPAKFWNQPESEKNGVEGFDAAKRGQEVTTELQGHINEMKFSDVVTPEIAEQMAKGDLTGLNTAFQTALKDGVTKSLQANARLLNHFGDVVMDRVQKLLDGKLAGRDDSDLLTKNFPSAANPALRPMIQRTFDQALVNSNGNRQEAITQTKSILKIWGQAGSEDLGINNSPRSSEDDYSDPGSKSLVEDLLTNAGLSTR